MVRAEAGVDESVFHGLRIEHCRLPPIPVERKCLCRGMIRSFFAEVGLSGPRTLAASHTRPSLSNIELWLLARESQIVSSPQYGDGAFGFGMALPWSGGPSDGAMLVSRTGSLKNVTLCVFGSRIGMLSVEYSGDPNSGP